MGFKYTVGYDSRWKLNDVLKDNIQNGLNY